MDEFSVGQKIDKGRFYGVYSSVDEVPTFGINVSDSKEYCEYYKEIVILDFQTRLMKKPLKGLMRRGSYFFAILPVINSIIAEKGKVNIVDFGGGQGENYIFLERFFAHECLEYHVIEQKTNCEYGRELQLPGNIAFHESIGNNKSCFLNEEARELLEQADICLLIGVVEFIFPYVDLLKEIRGTNVEYIFMTRTTINRMTETFFTRQYVAPAGGKYQDIVLGDSPITIINHKELLDNMCDMGYELLLDLFQTNGFSESESLPYPHNQIEYRDMIFRLRDA